MRIARDFGDVAQLLPDGVDLRDAPHHFFEAIRAAVVYLSFEELPKAERPPKRIWRNGEALDEWFRAVEAHRERDARMGAVEDPVENEAAKDLIVG